MEPQILSVRGARMHNLKNINVDLPRNKLVVFTGLSGSGKSTLAFDTLYAEGQRRYVESLSTYARQFLGQMDKPDVDALEGLSPAVSIEQKTTSKNPRSTVGTVTEIYDHLRLLFARCGHAHCHVCGSEIHAQSIEDMVQALMQQPEGTKVILMAPLITERKGRHEQLLARIRKEGFVRVRIDGDILHADDVTALDKNKKHTIEVVVDRLVIKDSIRRRLSDSVATAVKLTEGFLLVQFPDDEEREQLFSEHAACHTCGISLPRLSTQLFSFNNPQGACEECGGLGVKMFFDPDLVVPDSSKSISQGALAPWGWRNEESYTGHMLESVARHYQVSLKTPFEKLPERVQQVYLYGSGTEEITFHYKNGRRVMSVVKTFEGVIPQLDRRYLETQSAMIREELGKFMNEQLCPACRGARLKPEPLAVRVGEWNIHELCCMSIGQLIQRLPLLPFSARERKISEPVLKEIVDRLSFLEDVGLGYLSLERRAGTLSGGEAQRIRLASQIGSRLAGVLYILDEPSIGLHQRDNQKLINTLVELRDLGNTVIVVEHDTDTILAADHVLDMGPGAGIHGGNVVFSGTVQEMLKESDSVTGGYLSGRLAIKLPGKRRKVDKKQGEISIKNANINNLKNIEVGFPVGVMSCVTGVSGSGKSSLVMETLFRMAKAGLRKRQSVIEMDGVRVEGLSLIDKIVDIDQSPIGRTPRSNPATYSGVFTPIRDLFARLPEARARGYKPGRFSFNIKGGRCEGCEGEGVNKIAMHFLPDIYVECEACKGRRYNSETLEIRYRDKNIHEVLAMTVEEALEFFSSVPQIKKKLQTLFDVGLSYISLGQSSVTLSGGEAQRVKLAKELSTRSSGQTLYILDEPTTGLHPADIQHLLAVLGRLVDQGNTVVIIEHNLDVIKTADWLIDIGPEGGDGGGQVVAVGPPESVADNQVSHTGLYLKPLLQDGN